MLFIEVLCDLRFAKQREKSFLKHIHIHPVSGVQREKIHVLHFITQESIHEGAVWWFVGFTVFLLFRSRARVL